MEQNLEDEKMKELTRAEHEALTWLFDRNSSGVFTKTNQVLAGGDIGPFMRATWNRLEGMGLIAFVKMKNNKRISRCALTFKGHHYLLVKGRRERKSDEGIS